MKRGQIWWFQHPDQKSRPVCILTRDDALPWLVEYLVAPVTSTRRGIVTEVPIDEDDGMPHPCVVALDAVTLTYRGFLTDYVTTLAPEKMHKVCRALAIATGC